MKKAYRCVQIDAVAVSESMVYWEFIRLKFQIL